MSLIFGRLMHYWVDPMAAWQRVWFPASTYLKIWQLGSESTTLFGKQPKYPVLKGTVTDSGPTHPKLIKFTLGIPGAEGYCV